MREAVVQVKVRRGQVVQRSREESFKLATHQPLNARDRTRTTTSVSNAL